MPIIIIISKYSQSVINFPKQQIPSRLMRDNNEKNKLIILYRVGDQKKNYQSIN